jgi:arsenate reductase
MTEGFLKSFDSSLAVFSAGTKAATQVHPKAIQVMNEIGIDLSKNYPKTVDQFLSESLITLSLSVIMQKKHALSLSAM